MGGGLTELDLSIHAQQDVVALDITMDYLVGVKELQRLQTLSGHQNIYIYNQYSLIHTTMGLLPRGEMYVHAL